MEKINRGIVFSNDIEYIIKGNNALDFSYEDSKMVIPSSVFIDELRDWFRSDVNKIFKNQVVILSEEEMISSIYCSISNIIGRYPHNITG